MASVGLTRNIVVEEMNATPVAEQKVEVVERKGTGHPDTMCDSIMNEISVQLSKEYIKKFGFIAHHNIDKSLLVGGSCDIRWGGGKVTKPIILYMGDRATEEADGKKIDVHALAIKTAKKWIRDNIRFLDPVKHVQYHSMLRPGSPALVDIFKRGGDVLGANDTSAAVGYAPWTPTEKTVFETERLLNSKKFKKSFPETGEDIKVMGLRTNGNLLLTVALAFVDRYIKSEKDYFRRKEEVLEALRHAIVEKSQLSTKIDINTLDEKGRGIDGVYLTVTGTSADSADCGEVGRGNRVNGIIPLNRPVSNEAAAGKNPVSHVGKIYNVMSHIVADEIYKKVPGIKEVYFWMLSQIGKPIDQPAVAAAQIIMQHQKPVASIARQVDEIIDFRLANIKKFTRELAFGKYPIC